MPLKHELNDRVSRLLAERTGQDLAAERHWRIENAAETVMRENGLEWTGDPITLLTLMEDPAVERQIVEAVLNNETYFFRDRPIFDKVTTHILPEIAKANADTKTITIWSAACSTGQEPLSLAMLFLRQPALWADWRIDIRATDISDSALASARRGVYSNFEVQRGLGVTEMLNFFDDTPAGWRVRPAVMRNIRFTRHNLLDAPPMLGAFDLVLCRNVLLYLQRDARARVAANLASSMKHGGILLVGGGEVVSGAEGLLAPMENAAGFYTRRAVPAAPGLRKSA